ncbi:MAG: hypothetical protein K0U47_03580 [Epsilonproteobacteria bacterium]|nr:hypothetical protein [Campylobacterota bacterium]
MMKLLMKLFGVILSILLVGCGSTSETNLDTSGEVTNENNLTVDQNETNQSIAPQKVSKTVTIYVHGYDPSGYKEEATYGNIKHERIINKLSTFTKFPTMLNYDKETFTNLLTMTSYYGDTPPSYYTEDDINDIALLTQRYNGGVPRYATIIAKFAKHILKESGADQINIVSGSFGSLITRWMIEKDIENLASQKKIAKWLTIEGVIRGNYALSNDLFINIADNFFEASPDTLHMDYDWIEANLTPNRATATSPYYKNILIGQISSTDSQKDQIGLNYLLKLNKSDYIPNDGYQLLRDTYFAEIDTEAQFFGQTPTHTIFHQHHTGIDDDNGALATITTFLESNRRVRITLVNATVDDIHEDSNFLANDHAEIVFESRVYSEAVRDRWNISDAISERVYNSGALFVYDYDNDGDKIFMNQVLFDDFVQSNETSLKLNMNGFEIDRSNTYNIVELYLDSTRDNIGNLEVDIPIENGVIEVISDDDWHGYLQVEVIKYPTTDS